MTDLQQLTAMLDRAGVGYGVRYDWDPDSSAVQITTGESERQFTVTEFGFDDSGSLTEVASYPGEPG